LIHRATLCSRRKYWMLVLVAERALK